MAHEITVDWRSYRTTRDSARYTCEGCGREVVLCFIDPHGQAKSYYRHLPARKPLMPR